jgi:hypothetical protein
MKPTTDIEKAKRQCWDCLKRRLVCDFTLPHCNKCLKNGRQCSGYDDKKPLQWVETGHVLSRKRRKAPPKTLGIAMRCPRFKNYEGKPNSDGNHNNHNDSNSGEDAQALEEAYAKLTNPGPVRNNIDRLGEVLRLFDLLTIKLVVSEKRQDEAHKIVKTASNPEKALLVLEQLVYVLEEEDIPVYNLREDAAEAVQAVHYCAKPLYRTLYTKSLI